MEENVPTTRNWVSFVSLGVFMAVMNLTIAGFGFERIDRLEARMDRIEARMDRIEARMDRIEARMDRLGERIGRVEQRVARIEGVLLSQVDRSDAAAPSEDGSPEEPKG